MVKACALLHQYQRDLDGAGRIVANLADYDVAAKLCRTPLARQLGGAISTAAARFYEQLTKLVDERFNTTEAVGRYKRSRQAINGWLNELAEIGAVEQIRRGSGNQPAEWRRTDMAPADVVQGGFELPTLDQLRYDQDVEVEPDWQAEPDSDGAAVVIGGSQFEDDANWPPF